MPSLPPLDCLRFFETAARLESFARAAEELRVTAAAVAHRIRMLEKHLGDTLFEEPLIPFCSPTFIQARTPRHTGRPARLAAAVPSRLGGRLAILVHLPRRTRAGLD